MIQVDYSSWLTKQAAADVLEVSTKTIEKYAKERRIQMAHWKKPHTGIRISVYHPRDVNRLREEQDRSRDGFLVPESPVQSTEMEVSHTSLPRLFPDSSASSDAVSKFLETLVDKLVGGNPEKALRVGAKLFLSPGEAADYSGLPQSLIRKMLKDGKLQALKTGSGWRIRRSDLEKL